MSELLATLVKAAEVRLSLLVNNLVSTNVSALGESLPADLAVVWSLACMASLMGLYLKLVSEKVVNGVGGNTLKLPSWEKLRPQPSSLQAYGPRSAQFSARQSIIALT